MERRSDPVGAGSRRAAARSGAVLLGLALAWTASARGREAEKQVLLWIRAGDLAPAEVDPDPEVTPNLHQLILSGVTAADLLPGSPDRSLLGDPAALASSLFAPAVRSQIEDRRGAPVREADPESPGSGPTSRSAGAAAEERWHHPVTRLLSGHFGAPPAPDEEEEETVRRLRSLLAEGAPGGPAPPNGTPKPAPGPPPAGDPATAAGAAGQPPGESRAQGAQQGATGAPAPAGAGAAGAAGEKIAGPRAKGAGKEASGDPPPAGAGEAASSAAEAQPGGGRREPVRDPAAARLKRTRRALEEGAPLVIARERVAGPAGAPERDRLLGQAAALAREAGAVLLVLSVRPGAAEGQPAANGPDGPAAPRAWLVAAGSRVRPGRVATGPRPLAAVAATALEVLGVPPPGRSDAEAIHVLR